MLDSKCVLIFFCFFEVHHIFVLLARARVPLLWCEEHTFAHSETFKKSTPFALKKIRCYERSTNAHEQQKRSSRAAFQRFTLFTHFFHFPFSVFRLFIYSNDCHSTHLCVTRRSDDDWGEIVPRDVEKKSSRRCRFHRHPSRWDAVSRDVDGTKDEEFVPTPRDRDAVSRSQRTDANDDVQRNREMAGEF